MSASIAIHAHCDHPDCNAEVTVPTLNLLDEMCWAIGTDYATGWDTLEEDEEIDCYCPTHHHAHPNQEKKTC